MSKRNKKDCLKFSLHVTNVKKGEEEEEGKKVHGQSFQFMIMIGFLFFPNMWTWG